ncbi:porin family protein [Flavobacterium aquidurense]|uniref:porin family protein n=1 Tax=Flavobacterium aquidurense TaxID=362413 RepID=UPI000920098A|nr:porin family protein [Flavobacterium aquidurense]SHG15980.1 Outer membrane protein beta-barrel domain-containing protein [Flavobacterium frigidimaris]
MKNSLKPKHDMRLLFSCLFLVSFFNSFAQEVKPEIKPIVKIDSLYREDQFYFSVTYNLLLQGPTGLKQDKFSAGLSGGFLRDMPINKTRTIAIAAGLGLSYQNFYQNLTISKDQNGGNIYGVNSSSEYVSNRYKQYSVDVPIEFRWRNSTYESYKFWRIYSGVKLSYIFSDKSILNDGENTYKISNNKDVNQFQYGVYVSAGYNTWNVYCYYGLNGLFDKSVKTLSGESIGLNTMNIGLIFYIL